MTDSLPAGASAESPAGRRAPAPFGQRLPFFLGFPLARGPATRICVSASVAAIGTWCAFQLIREQRAAALLLLALGSAVGFVLIVRYGFVVIERTAAGFFSPTQYPPDLDDGASRAWKLIALSGGVAAVLALVSVLAPSGWARAGVIAVTSAWLPATLLQLARTDRLSAALDLMEVGRTIGRIGATYLVPCLTVMALVVGLDRLVQAGVPWLLTSDGGRIAAAASAGAAAVVLLLGLAGNALFLTLCAMLGYLLYQHASTFGVAVFGPGTRIGGDVALAGGARGVARRGREALVDQMVAAGEIAEAIELLRTDLAERPTDLSLNARLMQLLVKEGNGARIETQAQRCLELYVRTANWREALDLVEQTVRRLPNFEPRETTMVVPLARAAIDAGRFRVATRLLRGFDKQHPNHPDVPMAYLLGARILVHIGRDADKARQLLAYVGKRYPESPAAVDARRLLERFTQLAAGRPVASPPAGARAAAPASDATT